jgi:hypothetical protein
MSDSSFETGEGSVSADRDPSSGADFVRATFSHANSGLPALSILNFEVG